MNIIDDYNFYMDSVSEGDLYQINNFDFPMKHVVLHGNNKDESELDKFKDLAFSIFNIGILIHVSKFSFISNCCLLSRLALSSFNCSKSFIFLSPLIIVSYYNTKVQKNQSFVRITNNVYI